MIEHESRSRLADAATGSRPTRPRSCSIVLRAIPAPDDDDGERGSTGIALAHAPIPDPETRNIINGISNRASGLRFPWPSRPGSGSSRTSTGGSGRAVARAQAADPKSPSADEKAIRAVDDQFVRDYNRGDSKALAALFTEDAESIEPQGERFRGRDLIERRFVETFAASPGVKIAIEAASIRFLSPDVAMEEGQTVIAPAKEARLIRPYIALLVKRDGRWLLSSIREEADPLVSPHDRLRDLEWLVGDWVEQRARVRGPGPLPVVG